VRSPKQLLVMSALYLVSLVFFVLLIDCKERSPQMSLFFLIKILLNHLCHISENYELERNDWNQNKCVCFDLSIHFSKIYPAFYIYNSYYACCNARALPTSIQLLTALNLCNLWSVDNISYILHRIGRM
jgi:hypothetical protein